MLTTPRACASAGGKFGDVYGHRPGNCPGMVNVEKLIEHYRDSKSADPSVPLDSVAMGSPAKMSRASEKGGPVGSGRKAGRLLQGRGRRNQTGGTNGKPAGLQSSVSTRSTRDWTLSTEHSVKGVWLSCWASLCRPPSCLLQIPPSSAYICDSSQSLCMLLRFTAPPETTSAIHALPHHPASGHHAIHRTAHANFCDSLHRLRQHLRFTHCPTIPVSNHACDTPCRRRQHS